MMNVVKQMKKSPFLLKTRMISGSTKVESKSKQRLKNTLIFSSFICLGTVSSTYGYIQYKEYINSPQFIKNKIIKYINDPSYVYKKCKYYCMSSDKHQGYESLCIVVLQRLNDTITNENRGFIVNDKFAKFRGNKFLVKEIISLENPDLKIETAYSKYGFKVAKYKIGEFVVPDKYDSDNTVCTNGIHFFKTVDAAYHFDATKHKNYTGYEKLYEHDGEEVGPYNYYFNGIGHNINENEGRYGYLPFWRKAFFMYDNFVYK